VTDIEAVSAALTIAERAIKDPAAIPLLAALLDSRSAKPPAELPNIEVFQTQSRQEPGASGWCEILCVTSHGPVHLRCSTDLRPGAQSILHVTSAPDCFPRHTWPLLAQLVGYAGGHAEVAKAYDKMEAERRAARKAATEGLPGGTDPRDLFTREYQADWATYEDTREREETLRQQRLRALQADPKPVR
jgi:hypothetical protein